MRRRQIIWVIAIALVLAAVFGFVRPRSVLVDLGGVQTGSMSETVEEEARTRVRNIYTVSAPFAGKVVRTLRKVGDEVVKGETVVAAIKPTMPAFVDERSRAQLRAALTAADAAMQLAAHEISRLEVERDLAERELARTEALAGRKVVSGEALDKAEAGVRAAVHAIEAATAQLEMRRNERSAIEAQLRDPGAAFASEHNGREMRLKAPISGEVLRILQKSETVVPAGTPLIDVADTEDLEIVADLLSADAVRVNVGAPVEITGWGGPALEGRVTHVEPTGFPEVSALGIEELRVNVIIEITEPPEAWARLGHDYRVTATITLWQADDVLMIPVAALFRTNEAWTAFTVKDGRAGLEEVTVGRMNDEVAEILAGLTAGDRVILYPSDRIRDGRRVAEREAD
ncbi:HlyD family efflux transporter periplasmic adaptor subunit [Oricola cellulosilytica]|uniref:HlyD family efflux transporter periplasmic adaptor subunit n=2 Tax=Oricola cellulosilytica TaxID=1429082 RepID=A0A4R0PIC1_9HYPH|nr:HlyD family efflux transporter periplasmic adaptor subunit [Oricola cellulosilytica]